jgi:hypothetical protein
LKSAKLPTQSFQYITFDAGKEAFRYNLPKSSNSKVSVQSWQISFQVKAGKAFKSKLAKLSGQSWQSFEVEVGKAFRSTLEKLSGQSWQSFEVKIGKAFRLKLGKLSRQS